MKVYIESLNGVLDKLIMEVYRRGDLVEKWEDADVLVLWQDVMGRLKDIATNARMMGKKLYVAEHGLMSANDYIPPFNRTLLAHKVMVWGEERKKLLSKHGINNTVVTGSTIFDQMKPKRIHEGKNVLFAPRHWDRELDENLRVVEELKKLPKDVYVYSKIVEGEHDPLKYPNPIKSNRITPSHLASCYDALKNADVLVTLGEGTISSLAYYLDIPVVSASCWEKKTLLGIEYNREEFFKHITKACNMVELEDVNKTVMDELECPEKRRSLRLEFLNGFIDYQSNKTALEKQLEVIYGN